MNLRFFRGVALFGSFVLGILPSLMFMAPVCLTVFIPSVTLIRYRRRLSDIISGAYLNFAAAMLTSSLTGTKVYFYSDEAGNPPDYSTLLNDRGSLFLSNHRCHIDWMYSGFCYASLLNQNGTLRFILKSAIRSVPFFGWVMSQFLYIFVKRKDKLGDIDSIQSIMKYLLKSGERPSPFLFPEGTDLTPENVAKSKKIAAENNIPEWNYVLYPKFTGLEVILKQLQGYGANVHDLTIAYKDFNLGHPGDTRPSEVSMWTGEFPQEVHIIAKRYEASDIPTDHEGLKKWTVDRFQYKENVLKSFYENGSKVPSTWPKKMPLEVSTTRPLTIMFIWVSSFILSMIYLSWVRWFFVIVSLYCAIVSSVASGFDVVELKFHSEIFREHSTTPDSKEKKVENKLD